jgi:uncharacterized protein YcbK (DUF882 family)
MTQIYSSTRRGFMRLGLTTLACTLATPALAAWPHVKGSRNLSFHNLHTDEKLHVTYWKDGAYDHASCAKLNHLLRDHYSGHTHKMDVRLFDLLHDLQNKLGNDRQIEVISGYRSPQTNMRLAKLTDGVAKNSYHTKGMAIDVRMDGTSLGELHDTALEMDRGGVGYYPSSDFVHLDVGPIRRW